MYVHPKTVGTSKAYPSLRMCHLPKPTLALSLRGTHTQRRRQTHDAAKGDRRQHQRATQPHQAAHASGSTSCLHTTDRPWPVLVSLMSVSLFAPALFVNRSVHISGYLQNKGQTKSTAKGRQTKIKRYQGKQGDTMRKQKETTYNTKRQQLQ